MEHENVSSINEKEVMDFYGLKGGFGKLQLRSKILRSWVLHKSAFSSINSSWVIKPRWIPLPINLANDFVIIRSTVINLKVLYNV